MYESRALLIARRLAIVAVLVVALAPVVWLFSIAYKPTSDIFASPPQFLFTPTAENFESVFQLFQSVGPSEVEPHHLARIDNPFAHHRDACRLRAGARRQSARPLARLLLPRDPDRSADRDPHPVLPFHARHRAARHMVGGDHSQYRAQYSLRRLDDVLATSGRLPSASRKRRSRTAARTCAPFFPSRCRRSSRV